MECVLLGDASYLTKGEPDVVSESRSFARPNVIVLGQIGKGKNALVMLGEIEFLYPTR